MRYRSVSLDDGNLRARLHELAAVPRRFGYRRLLILLRREGTLVNRKKLRRLYRGGTPPGTPPRRPQKSARNKSAIGVTARTKPALSLDFLSDQLSDGRRFRILAVVDDFIRECLPLVVDTSLPGARVERELDAIMARRGRPLCVVSDNGTELTSVPILRWSQDPRIQWDYIAPGKPTQNAFTRRCSLARSRTRHAGELEGRLQPVRPHSAIGNVPPAIYAKLSDRAKQRDGSPELPRGSAPVPLHHQPARLKLRPGSPPNWMKERRSGHAGSDDVRLAPFGFRVQAMLARRPLLACLIARRLYRRCESGH